MATTAELQNIRELLNNVNIAAAKAGLGDLVVALGTNPASTTTAGVVKKAAFVANANVDNSDAGAKINAILTALKASNQMATS